MKGKRGRIKKAVKLFEDFTGETARQIDTVSFDVPDVAILVGNCRGIIYDTKRDGLKETYIHRFTKRSAPLLCVSANGEQLLLVGGKYRFLESGINDR